MLKGGGAVALGGWRGGEPSPAGYAGETRLSTLCAGLCGIGLSLLGWATLLIPFWLLIR